MEESKSTDLKKEIIDNIKHEISDHLFSKKEMEDVRLLLEQDRRAKWFWTTMRTWVLAVSSIIAVLYSMVKRV